MHSGSPSIDQMLADTESVIARRYKSLRSVVLMQDGNLLCACDYHNKSTTTSANSSVDASNSIAPIHSVTKSVVALLVGQLVDRSLIEVEQPLVELLPAYKQAFNKNADIAQVTLHQLLSMTPGLLWRNARAGLEPMVGRMMQQPDWVAFTLSLPVKQSQAGQFQYNSAVSHLLSAVIEAHSGQRTVNFAAEHLFTPLGIDEYTWEADSNGVTIGGWGLSLSPRAMARIGQLCIDNGVGNGKQLVSAQWIKRMWTPYSEAHSLHAQTQPASYPVARYGYQWWIRGDEQLPLYCAEGLGGQSIYCLPKHGAVIVTRCDYPGRRTSLWPLFEEHWLPVVMAAHNESAP